MFCAGGALVGLTGCIPPNPRYMSASVERRIEAPPERLPETAPLLVDSLDSAAQGTTDSSTSSDTGSHAPTSPRMDGISFAEAFDSTEESEPVDSRLMDVVKPAPLPHLERLRGGLGIVADDVGAGLLAGAMWWLLKANFDFL